MSNKVLYISQEITPYLSPSNIATTGNKLPHYAQEHGNEVRIFMPKYGSINERRNQLHEVIRLSGMNVVIDDTDHPLIIKVATLQPSRLQVYFIDSDDYFVHKSISDIELSLFPEENDERMMFFAHGVIETVKKLRWEPNIIHCQGWVSALAPLYIKTLYNDDPMYRNSKIVYSLFDEKFDGYLDSRMIDKLMQAGVPKEVLTNIDTDNLDFVTLSRLAIDFSDAIVIASPNIPESIINYAQQLGKPMIDMSAEDASYDSYSTLYDNLLQ